MRVLQVEDEVGTAKAVEQMLRADGHDCDTTDLGEDAVRLARENDYDVILLDVMLPDIDGYEVLKRLWSSRIRTPVIFQSGLVRNASFGYPFGVGGCLVKPYDQEALRKGISAVTETGGQGDGRTDSKATDQTYWERRVAPRTKTLKGGEIANFHGEKLTDCLILSLSEGGAAVQPADLTEIKKRFPLRMQGGPSHACEVRWRHRNKLGIRFVRH